VIPADAPVPEDMSLYRRVHPSEIVWDDNDQCPRPNSSVFKDREMSIHLADVLEDEGREAVSVLEERPEHSLVTLTVGFVQSHEQEVRRSPLEEDPSHGDVVGSKPKTRRRAFAQEAAFVVRRDAALDPEIRAKVEAAQEQAGK
jgi:hypothetical protein